MIKYALRVKTSIDGHVRKLEHGNFLKRDKFFASPDLNKAKLYANLKAADAWIDYMTQYHGIVAGTFEAVKVDLVPTLVD